MTEEQNEMHLSRGHLYGTLDLNKLSFDIDNQFRDLVKDADVLNPIVLIINHDFLSWCHQEDNAFWEYISTNEFFQLVSHESQFMPLVRGIMLGGNHHVEAPTKEEIKQLNLSEDEEVPEQVLKLKPELTEDVEIHFHLKDYKLEEDEDPVGS